MGGISGLAFGFFGGLVPYFHVALGAVSALSFLVGVDLYVTEGKLYEIQITLNCMCLQLEEEEQKSATNKQV